MKNGPVPGERPALPELSDDQAAVLRAALDWYGKSDKQVLTIGGYAGTGKTTLIGILRNELARRRKDLRVALAAYTGKASRVLESKIRDAFADFSGDYVGTLHGLIYSRRLEEHGRLVGWRRRPAIDYDFIIVDEASMVDEEIWRDLLSFGKRVVAVGDHGQLPPIDGKFNLMESPDLRLLRIHRQAAKNPILRLSQQIRENGVLPEQPSPPEIRFLDRGSEEAGRFLEDVFAAAGKDTLVLCGSNQTRVGLNRRIRESRGFEGPSPERGDRVICLRNNWEAYPRPICNGMLGTVTRMEPVLPDASVFSAVVAMDGEDAPYEGYISGRCFDQSRCGESLSKRENFEGSPVDYFDFGYALTVHKAQGSEAPAVAVFVENFWSGETLKRWLYTAVTRARERLIIIR
ncbi:MAG TPA: AAA family ATPase [Elusimicrobiota bacterium]|nr:AAA family ATPase [Elusimicrobiota bacterium]